MADSQGDVIFSPDSQDTGNLQEVTHDSSQDTTDFQQKVTLPEDATNKSYLPITQAGFRKGRSVRDNTFSLRMLMEMAIELEKELIVVFVDMEKAFDRISHAFLEEALSDAGASDKSIAMIRVLYAQTKAKMRVTAADGTQKYSREFPINRGVLQGDLVSPLLFIIALEYAFRKCDTGSSFSILGIFLDQLTYADDSALLCPSVEEASTRMAALKKGLLEMADMSIHDGKTKVMHTQKTIVVPTPKPEEYSTAEVKALLKFECEACGMTYPTKAGLNIHQARYCDMHARQEKMDYPVEKVLDSRGPIEQRFYFLKYKGYGPEYNKWSSARWCNCSKKIAEFWQSKGMCEADIIPEGPNPHMGKTQGYTHRCIYCNQFYKTSTALKSHHNKKPTSNGSCKCKPKTRAGTLAEKAVKRLRRKQAQKDLPTVTMGDIELENVLTATYLGSEYEADGNSNQARIVRMAIAKQQFGRFMPIWMAKEIDIKQKLRLYSGGVISVLSSGHETWKMDPKTLASLKGWNARCLSVITGREIADEHRHPTYNLDHALRARRLRWAGQLLRKEQDTSLPTQVIIAMLQHDLDTENTERYSLLMDAPRFSNVEEAVEMAKDTHMWANIIRELDPTLSNDSHKRKRRIGDIITELNVNATEWKQGADIHDGQFHG